MRLIVIAVVVLASAAGSRAQSAGDSAAAEQLFRDGQDLLKAGKIAQACEAFEGSQRLEPRPATLINLAHCRERNRQLATAWALYLQVVSQLRTDPSMAGTARSAREKATAIEPRLSHLIVNVPEESQLEGLTITRNGIEIDRALWNRAMPVDGGTYEIVAKAPDHEAWSSRVTVEVERDKQSVDVPRFKSVSVGSVPAPGGGRASEAEQPPGSTTTSGMGGRRKVALGLAAGTLALLAGATVIELQGRRTYDDYDAAPAGDARERLYDEANGKHRLAQGLGLAGAALAGAAVYLWISGRTHPAIAPAVGDEEAGVVVRGTF